ncbi:MAG: amidohydrolase family protein [Planctomycetota bacterium]
MGARYVVAPDRLLAGHGVRVDGEGRIAALEPVEDDGAGGGADFVAPGLIDLQVNGFAGEDLHACDEGGFARICRALPAHGVTGFLPTLISAPAPALLDRLALLAGWLGERRDAATPLGVHLEGPFLAPARRGAHPAEGLARPDPVLLDELCAAAGPALRLLTLAPELPGALDLVEAATARGVVVALGHSEADAATVRAAVARGARLVTHCGNAMPPITAREPGLAGAALVEPALRVAVIADGVHVAPEFLRLAHAAKGAGLVLTSDAISGAGLGDGRHLLGGREVHVAGGVARDPDGRLAGSTTGLFAATAGFAAAVACSPVQAFLAAASGPADLLGTDDRGALSPGRRADLLRLRAGACGWALVAVHRGGRILTLA